ncbi:hypothetical protein CKA32_002767 [Geitlerinema sp. FC II]|nr:hypothetical protein CKA32_002767 [Geitlerinema sp. FC II]
MGGVPIAKVRCTWETGDVSKTAPDQPEMTDAGATCPSGSSQM